LEAESPSIGAFWLLLVLVVSVLLTAPFIITVRWWDEGIFLLGAERLLHGDRLYADFFEFLPPGSFLITAGWLAMVGTAFWSVRCLAILVILGVSCLIYLTCRSVLKNAAASALFAVAWLVSSLFDHGMLVQISHHWFTILFSMTSARAAIARTEGEQHWLPGPLVAGLAAGAAAMVTPTQGVAAAFAAATAYLNVRRYRAETGIFMLGCAIVPIGLLVYLLAHGTLIDAYQDVIVFPAERYLAVNHIRYASPEGIRANIMLAGLFPLAALLTIATLVATWRTCHRDRKFYVCIAFGLAGWVGVAPRPDFWRFIWSAPLVCPLLAYCAHSLMRTWRPLYRYMPVVAVILLCIPSAHQLEQALRQALRAQVVETPRGEVTYRDPEATANERKIMTWMTAAPAQDKFFFYPYVQMLPFLVRRTQVSRYDVFLPQYTTPAQYHEACLDVMRQASWVVRDRRWEDPIFRQAVGVQGPLPPESGRFEKVLDEGFEPIERFGVIEIRKRREQASEAACAGISP
jgi:hypothetical protein